MHPPKSPNLIVRLSLQLASMSVGLGASLLLYKIALQRLGAPALGTWVAVSSLCGALGWLEAGLGTAVNTRTTAALSMPQRPAALIGTSLALYAALTTLVLCLCLILRPRVGAILHLPAALWPAARAGVLIYGANLGLVFLASTPRWSLYGAGHAELVCALLLLRHVLYAALGLFLLHRPVPDPCALGYAALIADAALLLSLWPCALRRPWLRPGRPCRRAAHELIDYCRTVVLAMVGLALLRNAPLPLISRHLGPAAAAAYAPAERLATVCSMLLTQLCTALSPSVGAACRRARDVRLPALTAAGRLGLCVGLPPVALLLGCADLLLRAWLGPVTAAAGAPVLRLLGLMLCAQLLSVATDVCAFAIGQRRLYGRLRLLGGATAALLSTALIGPLGAPGVALSVGLVSLLFDGALQPLSVLHEQALPARRFFASLTRRLGAALVALVLLTAASRGLLLLPGAPGALPQVLALLAGSTALGWAACAFLYLDARERRALRPSPTPMP